MASVRTASNGSILTVTIDRPDVRNAVDRTTAAALAQAFRDFDADNSLRVAVLTGAGGHFCAGADLKAISRGDGNRLAVDGDGPMGPTRMTLDKPVIAAVEGYAVAGGLELALWCDLRVAGRDATFGVFCRRVGVPLIDGGTVRLPRLVGHGRAMDLILTGRSVSAQEALEIGLINRLCEPGEALKVATDLAVELARLPQAAMLADRQSARAQWDLTEQESMLAEFSGGLEAIQSGETRRGAERFQGGAGRGGSAID
jgi:enoyl-CoA hydratase